ncbi:MAG TPA: hypothetical protein VL282_15195 [Tepidisphaeraceae bacterium]|jgi:hypothetical protein|nr:hypothetical protein [Tepidisphaeraceae bacterium]
MRRSRASILIATALVMLIGNIALLIGYARGDGTSEMKGIADAIWEKMPAAVVYDIDDGRKRAPPDLAIYLNRVTPLVASIDAIPQSDAPQLYIAMD